MIDLEKMIEQYWWKGFIDVFHGLPAASVSEDYELQI